MNKPIATNEARPAPPTRPLRKRLSLPGWIIGVGIAISVLMFYLAREDINAVVTSRIASHVNGPMLMVMALPYLGLLISLVLTWSLVGYMRMVLARSARVTELVTSLSASNDELNQRIADEARMARALQNSERRYRELFENAGIGICQIAPSGEWLKVNRAAAHILGYGSPQELLAAQPDYHGKLFVNREQRRTWFEKLRADGQRDYEAELLTHDQRRIWVSMSGYTVPNGKKPFFECTLHDITERRRVELDLIRAKEQADFANRSKSEFLANMSHELRTPLNAILGFSEIIKTQMFGAIQQPQYVEYAQDIYDSGSLLLSLINDILDMSKIEAGKRELSEAVVNFRHVIEATLRLMMPRVKLGKLQLQVDVPKDLPELRGEDRALKQILTNLLTNAVKFTPEGGRIVLEAGSDDRDGLFVRIQDTGIGMSPDDIPIALSPFGQIESVLSRKNQGTGLGLPLTEALTRLHGGSLELQSAPGEGTTVTVRFPAERVVSSKPT